MSSHEQKTSKISLVLRTRENSDVFNTLDEMYLVFTSKKKIPSISSCWFCEQWQSCLLVKIYRIKINEPQHEKTNNVAVRHVNTQINLDITSV